MEQAFVTLATNDVYCQGALVLGQSLRTHGTSRRLALLVTSQVTHGMRTVLSRVFDEVIEVGTLDSADSEHLALMRRPELGITFTKLQCWTLTQYSKCVFMDADTLVLCNVDELFDRDEFSAAPDSGWPDCFNSGVFVFRPSLEMYARLLQFAVQHGSFDGGDQGLLNSFFSNWATTDISKHLPFVYNLSSSSVYTYTPAFRQFGQDAKVVHFTGSSKPWHCKYNPQTRTVTEDGSPSGSQHLIFTTLWWETYTSSVLPLLVGQGKAGRTEGQEEKHHFGGIEVTMKRECQTHTHADHSPPPEPPEQCVAPDLPDDLSNTTQPILPPETGSPEVLVCDPEPPASATGADIPASEPPTTLQAERQAANSPDASLPEAALDLQMGTQSSPDPLPQEPLELGHLSASVTELFIQAVEEEEPRTEEERRKWEEGQIDYMGKDAFENIKKRLDRFLQ
ncbi:glycogenin-2 isoform X2 [Rhinatrema bivittatum]|nr:glycogenin-2 isoform X2 [Rhinatrema bivittatum]XP_029459539.1 glycogenin-2 isoform X2 [Rhinatrema bivittatum]XP_029459540.1 glycogenin-2 isoform X2 [Rhinatrema bivittatum]